MDLSKFDGHTSGPWVSQDASQPDCPFFYVRVAATGEWIVMVCDTEKRGHESTEANAALIAAAPDLLAEVRRLREVLGEINTVAGAMEQLAVTAGVRFDAAKWREIKEKTSAAELDAKPNIPDHPDDSEGGTV